MQTEQSSWETESKASRAEFEMKKSTTFSRWHNPLHQTEGDTSQYETVFCAKERGITTSFNHRVQLLRSIKSANQEKDEWNNDRNNFQITFKYRNSGCVDQWGKFDHSHICEESYNAI